MRGRESLKGELCARKLCYISVSSSNTAYAGSIVLVCGQDVSSNYFNSV